MDMSGTSTNDTAYNGAVCMSITVVGNTTNLPLSDPFCNTDKCLAFKAAHAASQASVSYYHQYDYGHYTTWYYLAVLGVGMAAHGFRQYRNRQLPVKKDAGSKPSLAHKVVALVRSVNYRSVGGVTAARFGLPKLGLLAFLMATFLFFLLLSFLVHPYYRERRGYGSPPLGVRTGLMSTALTPIIVALSGKVNVVSWLTGVSHEKLNVLHRWASYICLFLAVVHTVPFIVQPLQKCGAAGLHAQFYKPGAYEYTGVPPLAVLVGLCTLSIPFIRHRFYNLFYRVHIPMYIVYLGLMFWHADNEQDSWAYLWATLAVWLFSIFLRLFYKWQTFNIHRSWFSGFSTTIQQLPDGMTHLTVWVPCDLRWKPGQHCFIRMPHLSRLQNNPFTIANLASEKSKDAWNLQEMSFYVRAHQGLSHDLSKSAVERKDRSVTVHIDGPYGGIVENISSLYQSLVFVAGGSGISACLPHILDAAHRMHEGTAMVASVHLIWMIRQASHLQWIMSELKHVRSHLDAESLQLDFYVTDASLPRESDSDRVKIDTLGPEIAKEAGSGSREAVGMTDFQDVGTMHNRRPFLPELLPSLLTQRRVLVFGCGPESLTLDLGNAVAAAQTKVLRGEADVISLHTEKFGW